jgi:hypothetical protein
VLLDRGDVVNPLIVGVGFIIGGDETASLGVTEFFQNLETHMAIQNDIAARLLSLRKDDKWFNNADFPDGGEGYCGISGMP